MRVGAKQYARILWDTFENKKDSERRDIVKNFVQVLWKKRQLRLGDKIIKALKDIEKEENGLVEAKVESAYEMSEKEKKEVTEFIKKKLDCEEVIVDFQVDKKLIGGTIIEAEDYIWDMSIAGGIRKLKQAIK